MCYAACKLCGDYDNFTDEEAFSDTGTVGWNSLSEAQNFLLG